MFEYRACEDDFDGDGIPDSEDVSLNKLDFRSECTQSYESLKCNHTIHLISDCSPSKVCPENKKISKASFKGLETMDLCARENITTCKMKMMMRMVMK